MRPLHGVITLNPDALTVMKQHALIFDTFYLTDLEQELSWTLPDDQAASLNADLRFLQEASLVTWLQHRKATMKNTPDTESYMQRFVSLSKEILDDVMSGSEETGKSLQLLALTNDVILRGISAQLNIENQHDTVPICRVQLPESLHPSSESDASATVIRVAMEAFPSPDETCAWQDILDFKNEMQDKQWGFRRFLNSLATKHRSEAEVRDDIEWMINEYSKAMALHKLKASKTFFEAYIIPAIEVLEDLAKFNWTQIAKLGISAKQRRIELLEAEAKAPGRECAYIVEARNRFQ